MKSEIRRNLNTFVWIEGITKEQAYLCEDKLNNYVRERYEGTNPFNGKAVKFSNDEWAFQIYYRYEHNTIGAHLPDLYIAARNADHEVYKVMKELRSILVEEES